MVLALTLEHCRALEQSLLGAKTGGSLRRSGRPRYVLRSPREPAVLCRHAHRDYVLSCASRITGSRIAVVGHSLGGHTAGMLLGARLIDAENGTIVNLAEQRIKAGVLLAAPGNGGADLSAFASEHYSFFRQPSFAEMTTPALVVLGDKVVSPHLTVRGADWHADPYFLSTGPKCLLTLFDGEHGLGGFPGSTLLRRGTKAPNEWLRSSGLPGRISAARFTVKTPPGRQRGPRLWKGPIRWAGSNANEDPGLKYGRVCEGFRGRFRAGCCAQTQPAGGCAPTSVPSRFELRLLPGGVQSDRASDRRP